MYKLVVSFACVLLGACALNPQHDTPRIDGSSVEAFNKSWKALEASLTPGQRLELSAATLSIGLSGAVSAESLASDTASKASFDDTLRSKVNGLTFAGILALAKKSPLKIQIER